MSHRPYVASENAALHNFVQERHDGLRRMLATQTQYFQDYKACLETLQDWHISYGQPLQPPSPPPF